MINGVNMAHNHQKLQYLKRAQLLDRLIELDIQAKRREGNLESIIAKYAHIICDAKNPYNQDFLNRFPQEHKLQQL